MNDIKTISLFRIIYSMVNFWVNNLSIADIIKNILSAKRKEKFGNLITDVALILFFILSILLLIYFESIDRCLAWIFISYQFIDILCWVIYDIQEDSRGFVWGFRNVLISILNYFRIIVLFAILYKLGSIENPLHQSIFSMTGMTFNNIVGKQSIIFGIQSIIGILYIAIIVSKYIALTLKTKNSKKS